MVALVKEVIKADGYVLQHCTVIKVGSIKKCLESLKAIVECYSDSDIHEVHKLGKTVRIETWSKDKVKLHRIAEYTLRGDNDTKCLINL